MLALSFGHLNGIENLAFPTSSAGVAYAGVASSATDNICITAFALNCVGFTGNKVGIGLAVVATSTFPIPYLDDDSGAVAQDGNDPSQLPSLTFIKGFLDALPIPSHFLRRA